MVVKKTKRTKRTEKKVCNECKALKERNARLAKENASQCRWIELLMVASKIRVIESWLGDAVDEEAAVLEANEIGLELRPVYEIKEVAECIEKLVSVRKRVEDEKDAEQESKREDDEWKELGFEK